MKLPPLLWAAILSALVTSVALFNLMLLPSVAFADSDCCSASCTSDSDCTCNECPACKLAGTGGKVCMVQI